MTAMLLSRLVLLVLTSAWYALDVFALEDVSVERKLRTNDNAPEITVNVFGDVNGEAQIEENTPIGSFIAHISVVDSDSGPAGDVVCIVDSDVVSLHQIYYNEYRLVTAVRFDRESRAHYSATILCQDNDPDTPLSSSVDLSIQILDVNDNMPQITISGLDGNGEAHIEENSPVGTGIARIVVTDMDSGPAGHVTCGIDESDYFVLNSVGSGYELRNRVVLHHEIAQQYVLNIHCQDNDPVIPRITSDELPVVVDITEAEWRMYSSIISPWLVQIMACRLVGA